MGSLQLDCPLCCSETFPCHNSLKYHLLSITDNLNCPVCRKKFEQVFELAMHIGRKCDDEEDLLKDGNKCEDEEDSLTDGRKCEDEEDPLIEGRKCEDEDDLLTDGNKCEIEEDPLRDDLLQPESNENVMEETSILAKALMQPTTNSIEIEIPCGDKSDDRVEELNEDLTEADTYFCSSCTINFYSVEDHIAEFHQGDEVFFKPEQEDEEETEASSFLINDDTNENETGDITNSDELLDTVTEEECIDKDGRFYTRKVVKIEKFWDKTLTNTTTEVPLQFYQCIKCKVKFKSIELFYKHSCATNETQIDNFKYKRCKICNSCFVSSHFLNVHMKTHKNKPVDILEGEAHPPFVCETCNTTFPSFKSLRLHKRMHEPIKSKNIDRPVNYDMLGERLQVEETAREMFVCEICNKAYDKEYEEVHKKFHSKESDFNCETCNRKFFSLENLNMHMKAHVDTKKFVCSYCKKGFLTQEKLDAHMLTKCQFRQYECQYCGRRFARPHEKVKHERIHTGEKPHKCEICGKAFRVSYCLTLHMRTHSGTRPYKCDHCGKRFKAHSVYNHHLLTHSDDRKYKCPFCPKTFKTGVQLAGHKNSHTKPFTCTKCHRPFASLYAVRAHMDTHERQNNLKYQCILCGATYARAFALRDHVKEQHPEEEQQVSSEINIDNITILDSEDYSNVETHSAVLPDGEHILIDVGTDDVESITI